MYFVRFDILISIYNLRHQRGDILNSDFYGGAKISMKKCKNDLKFVSGTNRKAKLQNFEIYLTTSMNIRSFSFGFHVHISIIFLISNNYLKI